MHIPLIKNLPTLAVTLRMEPVLIRTINPNWKEMEKNMTTILHLQRLAPTAVVAGFDNVLASSYSNVCPTTVAGDEARPFELD